MSFRRFAIGDSGAVQVVAGLMLTAILLAAAVGLTFADGYAIRTKAQEALDAAVLAGASMSNATSDGEIVARAQTVFAANRDKRVADRAEFDVLSSASTSFRISPTTVIGDLTFKLNSPFLAFLGRDTISIGVQSGARRAVGEPICVLGLDPTDAATIDMNGKADVNLENCAAMANSGSGEGIHQVGNAHMRATDIGVHGGYSGTNYTPKPTPGVSPYDDPLAALPEPQTAACHPDSGAKLHHENRTLTPGTYCSGLQIMSSSVVTLLPGIYIFQDGPLTIQSQATVTGREVLLAFLGPDATLHIISGGSLDVTSPTSGTYANVQFFGDRKTYMNAGNATNNPPGQDNGHLWFTVIGDSRLTYDGVAYIPQHHIWWAGGSIIDGSSATYAAVAKKLWFQDNTKVHLVKQNTRGLSADATISLLRGAALFR